jgi:glycerol-3-phosphate dehydrogenase (NAD(P)+)
VNAASHQDSVAVLGAGSWGTALAIHLARQGRRVLLWGRDPAAMAAMGEARCNRRYLPDAPFPPELEPTADLAGAVHASDSWLVAVPSQAFREVLVALAPYRREASVLVWATKGLEEHSGQWLHQVVAEELGANFPCAAVSGPSFAGEVARGLPTALTVASATPGVAERVAEWFHGERMRVYLSDDILGVQLGGAFKNVLAIAAGISDGLGFGANARAALITRGLAELMRLGEAVGARRETLMGLSGLGDLVLTCTDDQSRNRRLGLALGRGENLDAALAAIGQAVEGARTARMAVSKAAEFGVEMPICHQVHRVLYTGVSTIEAVGELLGRDQKPEF